MSWAYLFEAKGIQRYVFDSGNLRDLIGASDLVSRIAQSSDEAGAQPSDVIGQIVANLGLAGSVTFSRQAGGAFCAHAAEEQTLNAIKAAVRLAVGLRCPGLEFSDCGPVFGDDDITAMKAAYDASSALRHNSAAELPPTGNPYTRFAPRTGRAVTKLFNYGKDSFLGDAVSTAQRVHAESLRSGVDSVAKRFLGEIKPQEPNKEYIFPRNFDENESEDPKNPVFPFLGADRRIALIHADISGLGEAFQKISVKAKIAADVLTAAGAIEKAITNAARCAVKEIIVPNAVDFVLPARPILLGGDDITIIVRADLAFSFAELFLDSIEKETESAFRKLDVHGLCTRLSACAGMAIVAKGTPFLAANALAESLCKFAKRRVKQGAEAPYASAMAFHVAQSVGPEDFEKEILFNQFTASGSLLTGNPFCLGATTPTAKAFSLGSLKSLAAALAIAKHGRGDLFAATQTRFSDVGESDFYFQRWRLKLQKGDGSSWGLIEDALGKLTAEAPATSQDWRLGLLCDALEWNDLTHAFDELAFQKKIELAQ